MTTYFPTCPLLSPIDNLQRLLDPLSPLDFLQRELRKDWLELHFKLGCDVN